MTAHGRKACRDCGTTKTISQFYRHPTSADGHEAQCKACKRAYVRDNAQLKAEAVRTRHRLYERTERGKQARARYLANGGRTVYNATRRLNYRVMRMDRQQVAQ